jgi:hypothetical protein
VVAARERRQESRRRGTRRERYCGTIGGLLSRYAGRCFRRASNTPIDDPEA